MVDTKLLNQKIEDSGLKKSFICQRLSLSRAGFYKKVNNVSDFNTREVTLLCDLLSITKLTEKESIFFAKEVN